MKFVQHDGSAIYWGKLGDLVGDNELFDAYPQLKELTIYSNTDNDNQYDPKHNEIGLATNVVWSDAMQRDYNKLAELRESLEYNQSRAEAVKDSHPHAAENYRIWASDDQHAIAAIQENIDWMRDVLNAALVHEVQHAIQEIEGFARGGSPRDFGGTPDEMVVGQAIADRMAADRVIEDGDTIDTLREKFNERKDKEDFDTKNERRVIADAIGIMSEGYTPKDVRDLYAKEEKRLWDMYHDDSPESAYGKYNRLAGEVEARNVSKRMKMTDEQRRQSLAADTEDVARGEQIVRFGNGVSAMGSRVDKRMAEIGRLLEGKEMTDAQRKVADVFSGKEDNQAIEIERADGKRRVVVRQGNEQGAGAKHSVFGHYGTTRGVITAEDVLRIPDIIHDGTITEKKRGNVRLNEYRLTSEDGTRYTVLTEVQQSGEVFNDFYTNKKAPRQTPQMPNGDTQQSARTNDADALIGGKGSENSADGQMDGGETTGNGVNFRVRRDASGETADHTTADHTTAVEEARRRLESDDASEFERQAARAVIKAYGGGSYDTPDTPGGGVRFRTRDDADMLVDMAKHNNEVARQRRDAVTDFVKAITDVDELTDSKFATALGKVMRGQRTEGLKNVTVTYDDAGNLIPLSERFDRSNSDVRFSVRNNDKESEKISEAGRKGLNLQEPNQTRYGRETERDSVERRSVGDRLREGAAGAASGSGDRGNLDQLAEGVRPEQLGDHSRRSRHQQAQVGHRIVENAQANGLFIPIEQARNHGKKAEESFGGREKMTNFAGRNTDILNIREDEYTDDFRRIQAESQRLSDEDVRQYHRGRASGKYFSDEERRALGAVYARLLTRGLRGGPSNWINLTGKGNQFRFAQVNGQLFHDIFEINRRYLENGELVDLHDNYDDVKCFISDDGLCGFAIEPNGNLVSVFSLNPDNRGGFLYAIRDFAREQGMTHGDEYNSAVQPLAKIYEKTLGLKTVSVMDYNMDYDHDDIARNHGNPDVVFMVVNDGEVEARNVSERMEMTDEQRRQSLAADTEDVARDEQIVRFGNGVSMMGSRVDKRMAEIGRLLEGRDMTDEQRKVADVFSGKSDNQTIEVERNDGKRRIVMRQGNEQGAGAKHSVFGHYGTTRGVITADDVLRIPEVIKQGELTEKQKGKTKQKVYKLTDNEGNLLTVLTEINNRGNEVFADFYSNKEAPSAARKTRSVEAQADADNAQIGGKGSGNSSDGQINGGETTNFRVRDGRHGSAGIEGPRGERSGHEGAVEEARRRLESDDASEFERQAARAVIKAYGGGSDDTPDTPGGGVRFRTRCDADMLVDMAKHNNEVARQRRDAVTDFVKAITDVDELTDSKFATALGKVMRGQRQYDQDTVADITTMVKAMMDAGLLTELDNFSVKQILTKVKDSTGKNDITAEANKLIDIMLKHQLRRGKRAFEQQLKVKGMRQDSRGVVVQNIKDY